ncbi:MAG: 50S ribosomal protein L2 [Candidatus Altiarchaeota archaeon]|nr:50S ribosomal protein L2 [Candidatus Altiarchaeota archaeon]
MGSRLIPQKRGSGRPRFRSPGHRYMGNVSYPKGIYGKGTGGQVIDLVDDRARTAPLAKVMLEDYSEMLMIAPEGIQVGQWIQTGDEAPSAKGNILPLKKITEGTDIYNIELTMGDGGRLVRASGGAASIVSHEKTSGLTQIRLPSKQTIFVKSNAYATVGRIAAGGRKDKPMIHAGQRWYQKKARNKMYPRVGGTSMNAMDHPHGGGGHPHVGRPTTVSRSTPPGSFCLQG